MTDFIRVRQSQLSFYKNVPLYYLSDKKEGVLFKKAGVRVSKEELNRAQTMEIYVSRRDRQAASKEIVDALNMSLARKIAERGVREVRLLLGDVVNEALEGSLTGAAESLPHTVEVVFNGYAENAALLKTLTDISTQRPTIIEHSVNVLAFTMLYCCVHDIALGDAKRLGVAALLHDIGLTQIDREIIEKQEQLTDIEYDNYKTHTVRGHAILMKADKFEKTAAAVALEHHEKLDGSGYPKGISRIGFESQLIGLIDSYEPLTYRNRPFRNARKPYDSLNILKQEVMAGQLDKKIFKNFTACLTR